MLDERGELAGEGLGVEARRLVLAPLVARLGRREGFARSEEPGGQESLQRYRNSEVSVELSRCEEEGMRCFRWCGGKRRVRLFQGREGRGVTQVRGSTPMASRHVVRSPMAREAFATDLQGGGGGELHGWGE